MAEQKQAGDPITELIDSAPIGDSAKAELHREWEHRKRLAVQREDTLPTVDDMVGILAHPEGTEHVPCVCCGGCSCDYHGGEIHGGKPWCQICAGRGHHEEAAE